MKTYIFKTTATMKEYNNEKWWIDSSIIPELMIEAETLKEALNEYQKMVLEKCYITISNNAIKNKNNMFVDTKEGAKQVGYVITASTEFENNYKWYKQYINLWVNILTVVETEF